MAVTGLGINVQNLVSQLMSVERQPLSKMQAQSNRITSQISDLGRLKSDLNSLKSAARAMTSFDFLDKVKTESSDSTTVAVKASGTAMPSRYNVEVTQLASAKSVSYDVSGVNDTKTAVSGLQGTIKVNGKDVNLGSNDVTLDQFVQKVNSSNTGFIASAVKQGSGAYKVIFVNKETGETNDGASSTNWSMNSSQFSSAHVNEGKNAQYSMNGVSLTSTTNTVEGAAQGMTLTLNKVGNASIEVKKDEDAIVKKVQDFVSSYNSTMANVKSLRRYGEGSDPGGSFKGDSMLSSVASSLRSALSEKYGASGTMIAGKDTSYGYAIHSMGLEFDKEGVLKLDVDKLKKSLSDDPDGVKKMFSEGPGKSLVDSIDKITDNQGLLGARTSSLEATKKRIATQTDNLTNRLNRREEALVAQYSRLDATIAQMQSSLSKVTALFRK